jgi:hypothetical protein
MNPNHRQPAEIEVDLTDAQYLEAAFERRILRRWRMLAVIGGRHKNPELFDEMDMRIAEARADLAGISSSALLNELIAALRAIDKGTVARTGRPAVSFCPHFPEA